MSTPASIAELPRTYDPAAVEAEAYRVWMEENCFHAEPDDPGEPYCIVIPPPNVTGALHLGHAINNTLQDILIRVHRMRGFNTLWVPGIDHAGIATQAVVEKQLKEEENKTRHDVGREGLVQRIWSWKQQYGDRIIEQLKRLGCSCDWDRTRFTLDEVCARAVRETFFRLFRDGLIYRGKRLVNWDVFLQTSVSDDEIYHETVKTSLWHIRYPIVDEGSGFGVQGSESERHERSEGRGHKGRPALSPSPGTPGEGRREGTQDSGPSPQDSSSTQPRTLNPEPSGRPSHMVVATTRPETMLGDTAVAVHPDDPRWNWAIGKFVELPLTGRRIPVIGDPILVDPKFGTGCVKVTPAHDPNDYACWQRHQGQPDQIDIINIITPDGHINENGGPYAGMQREAARKKVVADLETRGLIEKVEPYETQVGHSDRSKTPIEPYLSDQWFVKMAPLAEPALEVVRQGIIRFFPERYAQQYLAWLGEKRDWPISRQLWWGHRIPVWTKVLESDEQLRDFVPTNPSLRELCAQIGAGDATMIMHPPQDGRVLILYCPRYDKPEILTALERNGFQQDPDVLDTWFSSALWPHSTLGWPEDTAALRRWYPTSVLLTGRDIITLWVARMVMMGLYNMQEHPAFTSKSSTGSMGVPPMAHGRDARATDAPAIPFYHVVINPTILDGKGERMSKSKGNGVDPVDIIETHGADALRFTLTTMATETQDARLPVRKDARGRNTSEKFDLGRNFCNKIWNAVRFALANLAAIREEKSDEATERRSDEGGERHGGAEAQRHEGGSDAQSKIENRKSKILDKWILSRLMTTIRESDEALAVYRFDQYARVCYDFFWRDLCDWYIEAIKPDLKPDASPDRRRQAADILAACLDVSLRLLHPLIPFITETIWWKLNEIRPQRTLAGISYVGRHEAESDEATKRRSDEGDEQRRSPKPEIRINDEGRSPKDEGAIDSGSLRPATGNATARHSALSTQHSALFPPRLILAPWPRVNDALIDPAAESAFARIQELIVAIRNLRNEHKVDPRKTVGVHIAAQSEEAAQLIDGNRGTIELLATCAIRRVAPQVPPPPAATRALAAGCEIFVEGLVDVEAEKQRLARRRDELMKQISALRGRLANEAYLSKAPPHLVQQTRDQLAAAEAELARL
jgi:valyl-tRNA synthetase